MLVRGLCARACAGLVSAGTSHGCLGADEGRLGTLSVTDHTVNVGNPLIFTKANIGNYNF